MSKQPPIALAYLGRPDGRPRWVTRLGIASVIVGTVSVLASAARVREAWQSVFDPTIHWLYPPPHWLFPADLIATAAGACGFFALAFAGLASLVKPASVRRIHIAAVSFVLPAIAADSVLKYLQLWPHPAFSTFDLVADMAIVFAILGTYPVIALLVVLHKTRDSRGSPEAV